MLMNDEYQSINCDDYQSLELTCQHNYILKLELRDGEKLEGKANKLKFTKGIDYLIIDQAGNDFSLSLDHILSFTHPKIGTVVVSLSD
ncbi:Rho-binding antiterminator [Serratia symbiotica]|uniref:Rho-binding antiterminator n=1 Tax=Serratia symbiotica TaxID=138074 RepID=UPI0030CF064B|nr:Rho-binding antiterminator [Serratia symbiotica]